MQAVAQDEEQGKQNGWQPLGKPPTFHFDLQSQQQQESSQGQNDLSSSPSATRKAQDARRKEEDTTTKHAPGSKCASPNCEEAAVQKELCPKCYVGQGAGIAEQAAARSMHDMRLESCSKSSSAPCSIGAGPRPSLQVTAVGGNMAAEAAAAVPAGAFPIPVNKQRAASLNYLPTIDQLPAESKVSHWLSDNSRIGQPVLTHKHHHHHHHNKDPRHNHSAPQPQPVGLAEMEETEPLANKDLIASGAECHAFPICCMGEGCNNVVQQEKSLCQQCRDILRLAHGGRGPLSVGSGAPSGKHILYFHLFLFIFLSFSFNVFFNCSLNFFIFIFYFLG
jgi:hypothetical protein